MSAVALRDRRFKNALEASTESDDIFPDSSSVPCTVATSYRIFAWDVASDVVITIRRAFVPRWRGSDCPVVNIAAVGSRLR